ncbi:MAG: glycoside hydrolase family 3 N-terminal domain-containing protein [Planctomycetota bacterium]
MSVALRWLGAMMMLGIRGSRPGDAGLEDDLDACERAGVRMVVLFDRDVATGGERNIRSPEQLLALTRYVRARLGGDALIAVDQEGGRVQRLSRANGFEGWVSARGFASLGPDGQASSAGSMACALRDAGIDINFAPCVDVDGVPASPVIGGLERSFAEDPGVIVGCARRVIRAHRACGVACVLKHFPGHGSATVDSHNALADVSTRWDRDRELAPYWALLNERVAVMTGHLSVRALDPELPASLSRAITSGLLRAELGFDGPVFTDALDMEGVRAGWELGEAILLAVEAGADVVVHACNSARGEYAADVVSAMEGVAGAIEDLPGRAAASGRRLCALLRSG